MATKMNNKRGYYSSPRWSAEIADCSMPMTFDTYSNCSYGCLYCFSYYQRAVNQGAEQYMSKRVKWVNVEAVKRMFLHPETTQFGEYIKQRRPMQWGGLSDQFDEYERKYGITLELLRFFREIEYPICFSTKGTWWTEDERYMELFKDAAHFNTKFSIITLDAEKAYKVERGVPSPHERLAALERIATINPKGGATLRLRPFIIGMSNPSHKRLIKEAGEAGASAVSTEFFCLEMRVSDKKGRYGPISEACGFDILEFYKKYSCGQGYLRLNRNVKRRYIDEMEAAAREAGLRFYVSDAHFKERCDNGSCCGLSSEWNYTRGQFTEALQIAKKEGEVRWTDIEPDMSIVENVPRNTATGFNAGRYQTQTMFEGFTMKDYLRWLWNNPKAGQSPYKMFEGIVKPDRLDENGDVIYVWDETRA